MAQKVRSALELYLYSESLPCFEGGKYQPDPYLLMVNGGTMAPFSFLKTFKSGKHMPPMPHTKSEARELVKGKASRLPITWIAAFG